MMISIAGWATTIIPRTVAELIREADRIVLVETTDVRCRWVTTAREPILVTSVTFRVRETWKGSAGIQLLLEFAGGTVGPDTMEVLGMPMFAVGDRDVLLLRRAPEAGSPLVGFMQGRLRIKPDVNAHDRVVAYNGQPLKADLKQVPGLRGSEQGSFSPLSLADAAALVRQAVRSSELR